MNPIKDFISGLLGRYEELPVAELPLSDRERKEERALRRAEIETQQLERRVAAMRAKSRLREVTK